MRLSRRALFGLGGLGLGLLACGELADIGSRPVVAPDASIDSGSPDVETPDEGAPDAPVSDTGAPDAATPDAGPGDAVSPDSGDTAPPDAGPPVCSPGTCVLNFASSAAWDSFAGAALPDGGVSDALGQSLGPAAPVCLNPSFPANCPAGAVNYSYSSTSWTSIQGSSAVWIWRADVVPLAPADLVIAVFEKTFTVGDAPSGRMELAVDDYAAVFVNGALAGEVGSTTDVGVATVALESLTPLDISPALRSGQNTIRVITRNGPESWGPCPGGCNYQQNPAGVLFAGTLTW